MPLLRRRRPDPPDWASFLDADGWHEFAELVRYEAGRRGWSHDVEAGVVREGDGSLSSSLYWLRRGDLQRLSVARADDGPVFTPPDELVEILNELAAADGD